MSDVSGGAGWWRASDDKWYPPESHPEYRPTTGPPRAATEAAATYGREPDLVGYTRLPAHEAVALVVPLLTQHGATVHSATDRSITGVVRTRKGASCFVALILLLIMILPGILYLIFGAKTIEEPFSITLVPEGTGTRLQGGGQGRGMAAAQWAISELSKAGQ